MAEEPIKLFASRAERYPQQTEADIALGATRAALAAIPVLGGSITEVMSLVLTPAIAKRRDRWFKDLAEAVEQLEDKKSITIADLIGNEMFISAVVQATRAAIGTHQREKLEALRNAVLNIALSKSLDDEKQIVFLNLIETFSETHLELLKLFDNPAAYSAIRKNELRARRTLTDPMVIDLSDRGLLVDPRPYVARTRESSESLTIQGWTLSPLGKQFLSFIATPEQLN
jgi:hypothetical protein